jgi:CheY-like chemotaxis protein
VGNAVKFTERGEVLVSVDAPAERGLENDRGLDTENETLLRFRVADTGIGIAPEKRRAIFEPFVQEDTSPRRRFGGTGLGLAISSRLVALMRGRMEVDELAGGGSIFTFTARLPVAPAAAAPAPPIGGEGASVLVVDDNGTSRRILAERLSGWGLHPTVVGSDDAARQALTRAHDAGAPFAAALIDADLGGPDAFALAAEMPAHGGLHGPVIMMLSPGGRASERCRAQGLTAWLTKPIKPSALLEALQQAFGPASPSAAAPAPPLVPASRPARPMRVLVAEDNAVNQRLIQRLLEGRGHTVRLTANGRETVEAFRDEGPFDAVIMDVQMPQMDGLEATAAIREIERPEGRHTPIIALTAHALPEDRARCVAAGVDAYLAKPIRFGELFAQLELSGRDGLVTSTSTRAEHAD